MLAGNPAGIYVDDDNVTVTNLILQGDGTAGTGILTPYNGGVTGPRAQRQPDRRLDQRHLFQPDHPVHRHRQQLRRQRRRPHRRRLGRRHLHLRQRLHQQQLRPCRLRRARRGRGCRRLFRRGQRLRCVGRPADRDLRLRHRPGHHRHRLWRLYRRHDSGQRKHLPRRRRRRLYRRRLTATTRSTAAPATTSSSAAAGTDTAYYADAITVADLAPVADADPETAGNQPGWTVTTGTEGTDQLNGVEIIDGRGRPASCWSARAASPPSRRRSTPPGRRHHPRRRRHLCRAADHRGLRRPHDHGRSGRDGDRQGAGRARGQRPQRVLSATTSAPSSRSTIRPTSRSPGSTSTAASPATRADGSKRRVHRNRLFQLLGLDRQTSPSTMSATARAAAFGLQHGSGLFIDGGTTPGLEVSVTGTTITDFQKTGALIFGVAVNFTGNTITGIGGTALTAPERPPDRQCRGRGRRQHHLRLRL